jgi:mitochondrial chaperone BCS1
MTVLSDFVEECRTRYLDSNRPRVIIHLSDSGMMGPPGEWGNVKTKTRRPLNTLALESGVMDSLLADVREFLDVESWYAEAGIPHHRGYLLHGPPGTGKSGS